MKPVHPALPLAFLALTAPAQTPERKAAAGNTVITSRETMHCSGVANSEVPAEEEKAMALFPSALAIEQAKGTWFVMVTRDLVEVPH